MNQKKLLAILTNCERIIDSDRAAGSVKLGRGALALEIFNEIENVHGKLWTAHTSRCELENARKLSAENPLEPLWNSYFIRELVLSAMGGKDTGRFHTRS